MSRRFTAGAVATVAALATVLVAPASSVGAAPATSTDYTVVAEEGISAAAAIAAIKAAGGTVVSRTDSVGMFQVRSDRADFASRVAAADALVGAARQQAIGRAPKIDRVEQENLLAEAKSKGAAAAAAAAAAGMDPLDDKLWGLSMVRSDQARQIEPGDRGVTVGVLDTGLDASNPDLAANFNWSLSRNFAPDMTDVDGPCEVAELPRPGRHRRRRTRHPRRRHHRRRGQRLRHLRRRAERDAGRAQGRPGLRLLLPRTRWSTRWSTPATSDSTWSTCRSTSTRGSTTAPPTRPTPRRRRPSSGSSSRG